MCTQRPGLFHVPQHTHTHTQAFPLFPLQPLFWLKTVQIAYSCGLDPHGRGAAVQTLLERCEIKPHLLWQSGARAQKLKELTESARPQNTLVLNNLCRS